MRDDDPEAGGSGAVGGDRAGGRASSDDGRGGHDPSGGFRRWVSRPEVLVGLSALVLSLCGLFISIYETTLVREEQRASVWPYVQLGVSFDSLDVAFWAQNTGVGPARVRAASVRNGEETLSGWEGLLQSLADEPVELEGRDLSLVDGRVLPPRSARDTLFAIEADDVASPAMLPKTLQQAVLDGSVDVAVCFCSVYDECWTTRLQGVLESTTGGEGSPEGSRRVESCEGVASSGI